MKSRLGLVVLSLLLVIPLLSGAIFVATQGWFFGGNQPAATADRASQAGAGASDADLRRAAGEAQTQAGFLSTGTGQLKEGTQKLVTGAQPLADGAKSAAAGANQLRDGMIQLQAGTGQLGRGATELANGVGVAVDNIVGVNVVRGQILTAVDGTVRELEGKHTPEAQQILGTLLSLRAQAANFELNNDLTERLRKLKEGSRELSNQLDVAGYGYHDGVYKATEGAKQLAAGLGDLNTGMGQAVTGVNELDAGAAKLQTLADNNKSKVDAVAKGLAVPATGQADASSAPSPATATGGADASGTTATGASAPAAPVGAIIWSVMLVLLSLVCGIIIGTASSRFRKISG